MKLKSLGMLMGCFFAGLMLTACAGSDGEDGAPGLAGPLEPVITDVSPEEVKAGQTVVIRGAGFGDLQGGSLVTIGGVTVTTISSWEKNEIRAVVPVASVKGSVIVTVGGLSSGPWPLNVLWGTENPDNAPVSTAVDQQQNPQIVPDGLGGAIITWADRRSGNYDIYAQRINSAGAVQWTADGMAISTAVDQQRSPQIIPDGSGGAIITWADRRSGNYDIYAQRINSAGAVQ